jgi:hypothetical protein
VGADLRSGAALRPIVLKATSREYIPSAGDDDDLMGPRG